MVRAMPWSQVHMNKMQTTITNIYFEMKKKKKVTTLRLVLDETEMLQAKESGAKTKGERSQKLLKQ